MGHPQMPRSRLSAFLRKRWLALGGVWLVTANLGGYIWPYGARAAHSKAYQTPTTPWPSAVRPPSNLTNHGCAKVFLLASICADARRQRAPTESDRNVPPTDSEPQRVESVCLCRVERPCRIHPPTLTDEQLGRIAEYRSAFTFERMMTAEEATERSAPSQQRAMKRRNASIKHDKQWRLSQQERSVLRYSTGG